MAKKSSRKKVSKKVARRGRPAGKAGASGELEAVSSEMLQAELARRTKQTKSLLRKRDRLAAQLQEIEAEIRAAGVSAAALGGGVGRRRASNATNLVDAMRGVLDGAELSVTELAEAVQAAGYVTTSPNFRTIVNQTLIKNKRQFKRVSRGVYTAK